MSSLLHTLFGAARERQGGPHADTETVRKIVARLEAMPPDRARYVAAFAFILARVANADLEITDDETRGMERIVTDYGGLPEEQAVLAVHLAKRQQTLFGGTENFLVTREFSEIASREQKEQLLHSLFAVAAADGSISLAEENEITRIAEELGVERRELLAIRSGYNDKRAILQNLPKAP